MKTFFLACALSMLSLIPLESGPPIAWNKRVYLASYPRSGNHWLRYLIEEATGVATSSVYLDPDPLHQDRIFPWGGYCVANGYEGTCRYPMPGEIFVVKTHFPILASQFDKPYFKAIRIIRNPIESFWSFYLYSTKRTGFMPRGLLREYIKTWAVFQKYWDSADNVLTVRYEDLCEDLPFHFKAILKYIGYSLSPQDIDRAIEKYPSRKNLPNYTEHFTPDDLAIIKEELGELM